jgi:DNA-binding transcriptional MerR regulator
MALSQITFDFGIPEPEQQVAPKKKVAKNQKQKPASVPEVARVETPAIKKSSRGRKSLKEYNVGLDQIEVPEDEVLFKKMYYPIGDVAAMFKVNPSLIRFWENEFDVLKPKKNGKGDRLFRPEDVKNLKLIYHLLRERKYTIEGARDFIKKNKKVNEKFELINSLERLKTFLLEIKSSL